MRFSLASQHRRLASLVAPVVAYGVLAGTSWTLFHTKTVHPKGERFRGAVFDGKYVYLVPSELSVALRFEARTPSAMPSSYHGSFL